MGMYTPTWKDIQEASSGFAGNIDPDSLKIASDTCLGGRRRWGRGIRSEVCAAVSQFLFGVGSCNRL